MAAQADLFPIGLAARKAGLSTERLRQLCDQGRLEHIRDASGRRLIPGHILASFLAKRKGAKADGDSPK